jgi:NHLM bacteriocin system ABC transporter peptidase/ATP-binding protein
MRKDIDDIKNANTYKSTPTVYQMEFAECGAASLAMIMAYFGKEVSLEQMRIATGVSRDGCSMKNIKRAAEDLGLDCKKCKKEFVNFAQLPTPCIINWNDNHFVVFEGVKNGYAYINDPAVGKRRLTLDELEEGFTKMALIFELTDKFEKGKAKKTFWNNIKYRLRGQYADITKLICLGLLLVVPGLMLPVLSQIFLDDILSGSNVEWFYGFSIIMICVIVLNAGLTFYRSFILQKLQNKMMLVSSHRFLSHLFRLPVVFFDQRSSGDLSNRVNNNNNISDFLAGDLAEIVLNLFVAVFYLILLLVYSPVLTLIGISGMVINMLVVKLSSAMISDMAIRLEQDQNKTVGAVYDGINITSTLKASGSENEYVKRILGYYAKNITIEQRMNRVQRLLDIAPQVVDSIANILILMIGGIFVIKGSMTIGMLVAFASLMSSFTAPVNSLVGFAQSIQMLKADMARVEDILNYSLDAKFEECEKVNEETKLSGNVELKGVYFGYNKCKGSLVKNFGFEVKSGSSVAFVGPSGCGKSTISKLISGLYNPREGEILMDGIPVNKLPKNVLAASVSTVSQDVTLFSGTIRDNLTMWNKGVLEKDMVRAAKDACIHDVITSKPGAYDFVLTEGATNLSGGQRQRLEIARALTTNPSLLIMDEATSALDPIVEKQILDNIKRRGCTCIIIAHRLSAIRDCDQIIVMNNGLKADSGTHDELMKREGIYKSLVKDA